MAQPSSRIVTGGELGELEQLMFRDARLEVYRDGETTVEMQVFQREQRAATIATGVRDGIWFFRVTMADGYALAIERPAEAMR